MIIRVFKAVIHKGGKEEFERFFTKIARPMLLDDINAQFNVDREFFLGFHGVVALSALRVSANKRRLVA
jgi:hypothetical protein